MPSDANQISRNVVNRETTALSSQVALMVAGSLNGLVPEDRARTKSKLDEIIAKLRAFGTGTGPDPLTSINSDELSAAPTIDRESVNKATDVIADKMSQIFKPGESRGIAPDEAHTMLAIPLREMEATLCAFASNNEGDPLVKPEVLEHPHNEVPKMPPPPPAHDPPPFFDPMEAGQSPAPTPIEHLTPPREPGAPKVEPNPEIGSDDQHRQHGEPPAV